MSDGAASKWGDLVPRVLSAVIMAAIGLAAVWDGGLTFALLAALVAAVIIWELTRMTAPAKGELALAYGALAGAAVLFSGSLSGIAALVLLIGLALAGTVFLGRDAGRIPFVIFAPYVLIASYGLIALREAGGMQVMLWLVLLVIATDTAGYFAGRIIGGPKFWPRVSPKKTWAGIIAGWVAAALVGAYFGIVTDAVLAMTMLSVVLSIASQMGDAAQSALKRHIGIKDSSNLIPGHGGVFDRFDALLGAGFALTIAWLLGWFGG